MPTRLDRTQLTRSHDWELALRGIESGFLPLSIFSVLQPVFLKSMFGLPNIVMDDFVSGILSVDLCLPFPDESVLTVVSPNALHCSFSLRFAS